MNCRYLNKLFWLFITIMLFAFQANAAQQVHLVVDVSGNIQRLDPQKQRLKAINDFIDQLPDGTRAGIWTYAKSVNRLVSPGVVNDAWRANAKQAVNGLSGYGPYSNVGEALSQATFYWRDNKSVGGRNVVLLTDSGLRVSDSDAENQAARDRLLNNLLPSMQKSGINVYVLGFDKADPAFYQKIGTYQSVAQPGDLPSAFAQVSKTLALPPKAAKPPEKTIVAQAPEETKPEHKPAEIHGPMKAESSNSLVAAVENTAEEVEAKLDEAAEEIKAEIMPAKTEPAVPAAPIEVAQAEPVVVTPATNEALGKEEAEEIRAALANAEAELSVLINEFASMPKDGNENNATQALSGQQMEQPLVVTLADGSVLVTPSHSKAEEMASHQSGNMELTNTEVGMKPSIAEEVYEEVNVEIPAEGSKEVWPMILTILVIVNLVVILLLFVGRFLWMRHKNKNSDKFFD